MPVVHSIVLVDIFANNNTISFVVPLISRSHDCDHLAVFEFERSLPVALVIIRISRVHYELIRLILILGECPTIKIPISPFVHSIDRVDNRDCDIMPVVHSIVVVDILANNILLYTLYLCDFFISIEVNCFPKSI